jgi:hypothetical protein
MRRKIGGILLTVTGILACPCHLVITLPLFLALFAGTAVGSFLTHNVALVYGGAALYFVVALILGMRFLLSPDRPQAEKEPACSTCEPVHVMQKRRMPPALQNDQPVGRR